jgi:Protein of unknown function (DUF3175)
MERYQSGIAGKRTASQRPDRRRTISQVFNVREGARVPFSARNRTASLLTFYINRAGRTRPKTQRERLNRAKIELKRQFGKE